MVFSLKRCLDRPNAVELEARHISMAAPAGNHANLVQMMQSVFGAAREG